MNSYVRLNVIVVAGMALTGCATYGATQCRTGEQSLGTHPLCDV
ncbi:MAG: hypothetical protein U1F34_05625 [Gammaproteobacteria bacterium]